MEYLAIFFAILARILKTSENEAKQVPFEDVLPSQWAAALMDASRRIMRAESASNEAENAKNYLLDIMAKSGGIHVITWQRDCDCVDFTREDVFYTREAFEQYCERTYNHAEGPVNIRVVSKSEYDEHENYSRDHVMEAFENGRGTAVTL